MTTITQVPGLFKCGNKSYYRRSAHEGAWLDKMYTWVYAAAGGLVAGYALGDAGYLPRLAAIFGSLPQAQHKVRAATTFARMLMRYQLP